MGDNKQASAALRGVSVLYEDNHLLVVDKPAGLLSQAARAGDDNLLDRAREYLRVRYDKPGKVYVGLVSRLDRNVSGALVLARTSKAAARLTRAFAERRVEKTYAAVVVGTPPDRSRLEHSLAPRRQGRGVEHRAGGKEAVLDLHAVARASGHALVVVELHTGRKHQIRAQLALAGSPILGDPLYGDLSEVIRRPALHALAIALVHPVRRAPLRVVAPLPGDLSHAARSLGLDTRSLLDFSRAPSGPVDRSGS